MSQNVVIENTNLDYLQSLSREHSEKFNLQKSTAVLSAQKYNWIIREVSADGKVLELIKLGYDGMPEYYETHNGDAAVTVSTDQIWPGGGAGFNLSGDGETVGEWDGGAVRTSHVLLASRVTQVDAAATLSGHATHVAGTLIANQDYGVTYSGMAYEANLHACDWNDDNAEMTTAASGGLLISNHSYGFTRGWSENSGDWYWYGSPTISETEDCWFGFYNENSQAWDEIAYNAPYYLIVKSAGNDRDDDIPSPGDPHYVWGGISWVSSTTVRDPDGAYDCIGQQGVAKNILTVGAIGDIAGGYSQPSNVSMLSFSSWGPTDDGRIKPDLVGNGEDLLSAYHTTDGAAAYMSGTSQSGPNVAGSLVLLQQHYKSLSGGNPIRASTLKALALHTADEAGIADGPDYQFGWGLLNTERAATLINSVWIDQTEHSMQEQLLTQSGTYTMQVTSDGSQPLKVTICWTDPAGTPVSAQLDPADIMLVNDLDVRITGNSTTYYPWKFAAPNPNTPSETATTGDNIRDNVEQVYIASPASGVYTITVNHKGSLQSGSQIFSLIMSGANFSDQSLPVILASFNIAAGNNMAVLNWKTESEIDNLGFNVYRSAKKIEGYRQIASYKMHDQLKGQGSSAIGKIYTYYDFDLKNEKMYWYKIEDVSLGGNRELHGPVSVIPMASSSTTKQSFLAPEKYKLQQNYPNPFNPSTTIRFDVPQLEDAFTGVQLNIFDVTGRKVHTLVNGQVQAGSYKIKWNGLNDSGIQVPSGVYLYILQTNEFSASKKLILLR